MAYRDDFTSPDLPTLEEIRASVDAAADFLRARWDDFLALSPRIIDLQHRAAVLAASARTAGDDYLADQARAVIDNLAGLQRLHDGAVNRMRDIASFVGLAGAWGIVGAGLGAIPLAQVSVVTGLALLVVWFFRAFEAESRKLDLIEEGVLTPEQAAALNVGPAPAGVLGGLSRVGWVLVAGLAAWALLEYSRRRPFRDNPDLAVWRPNPPEPFADNVFGVWYEHHEDGEYYFHEFQDGVEMEANPDGSVTIFHPHKPVWRDFA